MSARKGMGTYRDALGRLWRYWRGRCDDGFPALGDQHDEAGWRAVLADLDAMVMTEGAR